MLSYLHVVSLDKIRFLVSELHNMDASAIHLVDIIMIAKVIAKCL